LTENIKEYAPRKVVRVGNSIALILPSQWKHLFEQQNIYGIWVVITDKDDNQRIEVIFQKGK